jgi:hypothetical protein
MLRGPRLVFSTKCKIVQGPSFILFHLVRSFSSWPKLQWHSDTPIWGLEATALLHRLATAARSPKHDQMKVVETPLEKDIPVALPEKGFSRKKPW